MSGKMKEMYAEALERGGDEEVKKVQADLDREEDEEVELEKE
jgi:hypothetical protein